MNFETIKFEILENGIGILTLNRPEKLNAMNFQMIEDLHSILDNLMLNLNCRVLILKAELTRRGNELKLNLKRGQYAGHQRISNC